MKGHRMKPQWIFGTVLILSVSHTIAQENDSKKKGKTADVPAPKTTAEKVSYGIGLNLGKNLKNDGLDVDMNQLIKGIKDALAGSKPACPESEIREAMNAIQNDVQAMSA